MTDKASIFQSHAHYRESFIAGLEKMLAAHSGIGVFILVLANASFDPLIMARLQVPLQRRFAELSDDLKQQLLGGRKLDHAPDDLFVFLKLMAVGLEQIAATQFRKEGLFELQFNLLRAFRPSRMADAAVSEIQQAFNPKGFNFNKPFLAKEVLWQGDLQGSPCRLLYNKFPFAELHGLLVIDAEANKPQWLTSEDHQTMWAICEQLGEGMPGVGFGYNAYGAYASVNHQHFQMFVRGDAGFPVEAAEWHCNGGDQAYPATCERFDDARQAWQRLQALHEGNQAYNLLYRPGRLYILLRAFQGSYQHAPWTGGFAWSELCGAFTTFNQQDFEQLTESDVRAEFAKLVI